MTEFKHFEYTVSLCIHIDEAEIDNLLTIAGRRANAFGSRDTSFIETWKWQCSNPYKLVPGEEYVTHGDVGVIQKLLEGDYDRLVDYAPWLELGKRLHDETERLNAAWMAADRFRPRPYREELAARYGVSMGVEGK